MIPVGGPVPDFTLAGVHGDREGRWRLAELRGRWIVLFFYPADFTFVCPTEWGRVREFVFGIQDGLISNLGLVSGIQGATADRTIVLIGGITAAASGPTMPRTPYTRRLEHAGIDRVESVH